VRAADYLRDRSLAGTRWSIAVHEVDGGRPLLEVGSRRCLQTASVAKVFLLLEVAAQLESGALDAGELLSADAVAAVADSGLWQHLAQRSLPIADAALLVGAVSDNLATNVLLHRVGLDAVRARASELAPHGSTLHDVVRDLRTPLDPPALSTGTAADWVRVAALLQRSMRDGDAVARRVVDWLEHSLDHSMVLSPLGLDPLSPGPSGARVTFNKTGADGGVRADVGVMRGPDGAVAYAAICNWDAGIGSDPVRSVIRVMREVGSAIAEHVGL